MFTKKIPRGGGRQRFRWLGATLLWMCTTGCSFEDAAADGLYGGISSAISTVVSTFLLNLTV